MAIDSAEKRKSVSAISFYPLGPGVTPNSSKDAEWRQEAGYGYPGIAATAVVAAVWSAVSIPATVFKTITVPAVMFKTKTVDAIITKTISIAAYLRRWQ